MTNFFLCPKWIISLQREKKEQCFTQMQPELGVDDFGFLPRDRYPLVAVLMLTNPETRENYNIVSRKKRGKLGMMGMFVKIVTMLIQVASVTVLHVPDDKYRTSARILFQYLLTTNGSLYDLKVWQTYLQHFLII